MQPLVSVIIPCFNYSRFVGEAIESIMAQTHPEWEAIVVDDGSTDNTAEVVAGYAARNERVRYQYQPNAGLSAARNTGLALARGQYLQFLDADDLIAPTKLEVQLAQFARYPDADLVYGDTYWFKDQASGQPHAGPARTYVRFTLSQPPISGQYTELALQMAADNIFLVSCPLFKRSLAEQVGPFDPTLFSLEDWHYWSRAVLAGKKFVYDNESGTEFYVRSHGNNMSANRLKMWRYKIQARRSLLALMQAQHQTQQRGQGVGLLDLPRVMAAHWTLYHEERARFELLYGSILQGLRNALRYSVKGKRTSHIWYDTAYWLKERLLGRNK